MEQNGTWVYPGIRLENVRGETHAVCEEAEELEICWCRTGRFEWQDRTGSKVILEPGDFAVSAMPTHAAEGCGGIRVHIDSRRLREKIPEPLEGTGIDGDALRQRFCGASGYTVFPATGHAARCFEALDNIPGQYADAYRKVRIIELLLFLCELENEHETAYQSGQVEVIRRIHARMVEHMEQRFTIDELAKEYLINPTTLKQVFKDVYGTSIAAHVREHRLEHAAGLLRETELSIAEIAQKVGYDSQSKFTAAFRERFGQLPKEYRKNDGTSIYRHCHEMICKY